MDGSAAEEEEGEEDDDDESNEEDEADRPQSRKRSLRKRKPGSLRLVSSLVWHLESL